MKKQIEIGLADRALLECLDREEASNWPPGDEWDRYPEKYNPDFREDDDGE